MNRSETKPAEPTRYVFAKLPRCPECKGAKHRAYRSVDSGDDSRTKYTLCKDCGCKFIIILD